VIERLAYAAIVAMQVATRLVPMGVVRSWGTALGRAAYLVDWKHREQATENLAEAFPTRSAAEIESIVRDMFTHFGRLVLELLKFATYTERQMLDAVETEGVERARRAFDCGRGVLFFGGHFGYWEIHGIALALQVRPMSVLARPLDNAPLNRMLEQIRGCTGNDVAYRQGALRHVLRTLADNRGVGLLIDQHLFPPDAVYVRFFNRPAATTTTLAAIAIRTGAPVIPFFALPLPGGRYRLVYEASVEPPSEDTPDAIREFTQRCSDVLEMYVRRHPELWLWMHRRWRDVPVDKTTAAGALEERPDA
jgi:KDO2-lipid IV(A) lauroyltransferase